MKSIFKIILINFLTLLLISNITGAIKFSNDYLILLWAAISLTLLNKIVKPILNLLLLPINFISLGAFRWVVNLIVLLMVMVLVGNFRIVAFTFPGFSISGFTIPVINLPFFWSLILISFLIELIFGVISWLIE